MRCSAHDHDAEPLGFDVEQLQGLPGHPKGWKALTPPRRARCLTRSEKHPERAAAA